MNGIPCVKCGRFVGKDGSISVETYEMSNVVAGCDGICGRCLAEDRHEHPERYGQPSQSDPSTLGAE